MPGARRPSTGYALEWLQDISLAGLQKLARVHGLDADASVEEIIEDLRATSDEECEEGDIDYEKEEFYTTSKPAEEDEEDEDAEEDNEEDDAEYYDDARACVPIGEEARHSAGLAHSSNAIDAADDRSIDVGGSTHVASAKPDAPARSASSASLAASSTPRATDGQERPWEATPFVPAKSEKPLTQVQPFGVGQPLSARGEGTTAGGSLKSLQAASRKQQEDLRKAEAAAARRQAAAERRARISAAFSESKANTYGGAQRVINNKPRMAAWDEAEAAATSRQTRAAAAKVGQATRRQDAVNVARADAA